jgi:hypothetical protein
MFKYTQGDGAGIFPTVKSDLWKIAKDDLVEMVRTLQEENCDLRGSDGALAEKNALNAANAENVTLILRRDKEITDLKAQCDSLLHVHLLLRHEKEITEFKAQVDRAENESLLLRRDKKITELKAQIRHDAGAAIARLSDSQTQR